MNIIFIAKKAGSNRHTSLSHRHVLTMAVVGLLVLPVFFGGLVYQVYGLIDRHSGAAEASVLVVQQQALVQLRDQLAVTQSNTETHLNALAQRLGRMQAQLLRLNALGGRLTQMAKLDPREFDFNRAPAMGGPETAALTTTHPDLLQAIEQLATALDQKSQHLTALESVLLDQHMTAEVTPSGWPAQGGWVSSHFGIRTDPFTGRRAYHEGVDIAARLGSPVMAMGAGVISYSGLKSGYGLLVEITHGQGYVTRYAHAAEALVKIGDRVVKGQPIARVGSSGRSTGPHIHFEVRRTNRAVDPIHILKQSGSSIK